MALPLFGKTVQDLQSDIAIEGNAISGTLNQITDYTGFSGNEDYQSGHYLVLHFDAPGDDEVITVELVGGLTGPVTLDDDGIIVLRIIDTSETIKVTATDGTHAPYQQIYTLTGLTLAQ